MIRDELAAESVAFSSSVQDETVQAYCAGIEERIRYASSRNEAEQISERVCQAFNNECISDILKNSLQQYVVTLVNKHWNG